MFESNHEDNVKRGNYAIPAKSMNTMSGYEVVHNPQLRDHTAIGKAELQRSGLSVALTTAGSTVSKNLGSPTQHWKSEYKTIVDKLIEKERIISKRP